MKDISLVPVWRPTAVPHTNALCTWLRNSGPALADARPFLLRANDHMLTDLMLGALLWEPSEMCRTHEDDWNFSDFQHMHTLTRTHTRRNFRLDSSTFFYCSVTQNSTDAFALQICMCVCVCVLACGRMCVIKRTHVCPGPYLCVIASIKCFSPRPTALMNFTYSN